MEPIIFSLALTAHVGLADSYNNVHPHVRYIEDGAIAGAYYNSVDKLSVYVGHRIDITDNIGVEFAGVTGYPAFGPIAPYIRGTYDYGPVRAFVAPAYETWHDDSVNVGIVTGIEFVFSHR